MAFLGAHTTAHGRESRSFFEHHGSVDEVATLDVFDETGDVDADGATGDALRVGAVEATGCFGYRLLLVEALVDFLVARDAVGRVELGHFGARYGGAFFGRDGIAELLTPLGVARRYGV